MYRLGRGIAVFAVALSVCSAESLRAEVDFVRDVRPILAEKCLSCHGPDKQRNDLRVDRRDWLLKGGGSGKPAVVPGKSAESELLRRIASDDADTRMPPSGSKLSADQIAKIRTWIDAGAVMPANAAEASTHWSLKRPIALTPPVDPTGSARHPIDAFIHRSHADRQLTAAPPADRHTLLRRLYLDLTGLPPDFAELAAFESDERPDAWERRVDRLLADPRFGERWAQHWLDVVRFAETNGFEMNQPRSNAWPYRDYVIKSLNEDKPYDRFVREQIVGDRFQADEATGFLVAGAWDQVKSPDPGLTAQQRADELNEMISATGSTFLGMTIGCARCHDHKFDPISQADYYAMRAVFEGVQYGERTWRTGSSTTVPNKADDAKGRLITRDRLLTELRRPPTTGSGRFPPHAVFNVERFPAVEARFVRLTVDRVASGTEPCVDELEVYSAADPTVNLARSAVVTASSEYGGIHRISHINDGQYGNSRSWIPKERTKGWIQLEFAKPVRFDRIEWARDRQARFADRVMTHYRFEAATEPGKWTTIVSSDGTGNRELTAERLAQLQALPATYRDTNDVGDGGPKVYAGTFAAPAKTFRLYRGDPMQPREPADPAVPKALGPAPVTSNGSLSESDRRNMLADWVTRSDHPLTARVVVNRIWQHHFGTGIVATPGDFGRNGARPTLPELLDTLAVRFVEDGWSMKSLHRSITLSATYGRSSRPRDAEMKRDAGSAYLWRFPPRRLEAEAIRDGILRASGALDSRMGGPGFSAFKPNTNYVRLYEPLETWGPAENRRMVYMTKVRMAVDGVFGSFDCPDAGLPAPDRGRSTTAVQSLNLFNSEFVRTQADQFGRRVASESKTPQEAVDRAFQICFQRMPSARERSAAIGLMEKHGMVALARVLFNSNEFLFLP